MRGKTVSLANNFDLDPATGCWNWNGCRTKLGYGRMQFRGRPQYVHRIAAIIWKGYDPQSGLDVCHSCDNPSCYNPKHLFLGTRSDNMQDCISKGRFHEVMMTHCKRGHKLEGANLYVNPKTGGRTCRTCVRELRGVKQPRNNVLRFDAVKT